MRRRRNQGLKIETVPASAVPALADRPRVPVMRTHPSTSPLLVAHSEGALYDEDLERAIIGGALTEEGGLSLLRSRAPAPEWFSHPFHREVVQAIMNGVGPYEVIDAPTLLVALSAREEHRPGIGNVRLYIAEIMTNAPPVTHLPRWIAMLEMLYVLRRTHSDVRELSRLADVMPESLPLMRDLSLRIAASLKSYVVEGSECSPISDGSTSSTADKSPTPTT